MEPLKHGCKIADKQLTGHLGYPETKYDTWLYSSNELRKMEERRYESGQQGAGLAFTQMQAAPKVHFPLKKQSFDYDVADFVNSNFYLNNSRFTSKQQHDADFAARYVGVVVNFYKGHLR